MKLAQKIVSFVLLVTILFSTVGSGAKAASTYTVKPGDVLWKIAFMNNTTVANIMKWNQLSSDLIYPGHSLYVQNPHTIYTVKSGDTLYKIALRYQTTIQDIKASNYLLTDMILVGQSLKIPTNNAVVHTVQSGDTLYLLALKYGTTISTIKGLNGLTTEWLDVGQLLKISVGSLPTATVPTFLANGQFPLANGAYHPYGDTWNATRTYSGTRGHEGTDIMAPIGTPIYSATDGKIVRFGWNELGGWRISVQTPEGYHVYYAHMSKYASGMKNGSQIKKGQLIGYVGNTGYGPKGTSGKFESHLHFGMYDRNWKAFNAYDHLKYWESQN